MGISWGSGPEKPEDSIPQDSKVNDVTNAIAWALGGVLDWVAKFFWYPGWKCIKAIWRKFVSNLGALLGAGGEVRRDLPYECRERLKL